MARSPTPGLAKARFTVAPCNCESAACSFVGKRVVKIPGKKSPTPSSGSRKVA